jgi:pimeloyl-ACP methyl ester carboxylesterase
MRLLLSLVSILILNLPSAFAHAKIQEEKPVVVLVPGFFSSLAAGYIRINPNDRLEVKPYFSKAIVEALESSSCSVFVVETLAPLASLEGNGERLFRFLEGLKVKIGHRPIHIIGHSAGGLYALYAVSKNPSLNVRSVYTISTPYFGSDLVDRMADSAPAIEKAVEFIDFRSLQQFRRSRVGDFISKLRVPDSLKIYSLGSVQKRGGLFGFTNAKKLSWPMAITDAVAKADSDGIVTSASAVGVGVPLFTLHGRLAVIHSLGTHIPLEHWEQVQDYRIFTLLGVTNVAYIKQTQQTLYAGIAKHLQLNH